MYSPLRGAIYYPRLTGDELTNRYTNYITSIDMATLDGTVFRPINPSRAVKRTDNSGICYPYEDDDGSQQLMYGYIKNIYTHTLEHNGLVEDTLVMLQVHWYTNVGTMHAGRLPIVRTQAREVWNSPAQSYQYVPLAEIYAQNVVFMPRDAEKWDMNGELFALLRVVDTRL